MIKNDFEYKSTKEQLDLFMHSIEGLGESDSFKELPTIFQQAQIDAFQSQISELQNEIKQYELLISGAYQDFRVEELSSLPKMLVRARIAKGITAEQLAKAIKVKVETLSELEEELYAEAKPDLIFKVAKYLEIDFPESIIKLNLAEKNIISNMAKIGMDRNFFNSRLLPDELKNNYNKTMGLFKLLTNIKRIFGVDIVDLLDGGSFKFNPIPAATARFKMPARVNKEAISAYTIFVHHVASILLEMVPEKNNEFTTDPVEFKEKVIKQYGEFSFDSCLRHIWDSGVPVLPLTDAGAFHGACWRINNRDVIVLKQRSSYQSRWLFDLLHEYWHTTQEPNLAERSIIELPETSQQRREDREEKEANKFAADVLLDGRGSELFELCMTYASRRIERLKNSVKLVALSESIDLGSLANHVAYELDRKGISWWGTAHNLQTSGENPYNIAKEVLVESVDFEAVTDEVEKEILLNAISN